MKTKQISELYLDLKFCPIKAQPRSKDSVAWLKIDYNSVDPMKTIAILNLDQNPYKIDPNLNFIQNCQNFQNIWNWSVGDLDGKKVMNDVVQHLSRYKKTDDLGCEGCEFNPNCFSLFYQIIDVVENG